MSARPAPVASEDTKRIIRAYVAKQQAELGPDWKRIKAAQLTAEMSPTINALFALLKR